MSLPEGGVPSEQLACKCYVEAILATYKTVCSNNEEAPTFYSVNTDQSESYAIKNFIPVCFRLDYRSVAIINHSHDVK